MTVKPMQRNADLIDLAIRLGVLGVLLYWSFLLVSPFVVIFLWSVVLAVALYPFFDWLSDRLNGRRRTAAVLITILAFLITIGPVTWLGMGLVENVQTLNERVASGALTIPRPPDSVKGWLLVGEPIYQLWDLASGNLKAAIISVVAELKPYGSSLLGAAGNAGMGIVTFVASVIIAGFLFLPAPMLVDAAKALARRIDARRGEDFVELAGATIRNVSRGVIGIAVLQALIAGIGLKVAGVPGASFISFAVLLFAIIQLGSAVVLVPVIIWSWTAMDTLPALLFTAYMLPINFLESVLRPLVIARGLSTPILVIFVGVIGGTLAHGIIGLFIGPVVLAVSWELLVAWVGQRETLGGKGAA
jgi:predicted PurR-regulated permease PerM